MTYRGVVTNGVVVLEGEKPTEGTVVEVTPVRPVGADAGPLPGFGIWRDRAEMNDSGKASLQLRSKLEQRHDHA
jgi:hypothetical protein